jgi:DNA-binding CsgD family transcriptional regulator
MLCFDVKLQILSDTEKRYAVMIALDIPYKSISEILNVKPQTVAQYRNRIRKKLCIVNTETDLNTYLKTFLEE